MYFSCLPSPFGDKMQNKLAFVQCTCKYGAHANDLCILCVDIVGRTVNKAWNPAGLCSISLFIIKFVLYIRFLYHSVDMVTSIRGHKKRL